MFPPDPEDGTIIELVPGVFYQYDESQNSWLKLDGFSITPNASQAENGLMPKEDLVKLNGIMTPPPRITLTGSECGHVFSNGIIGIRSSKEHLKIESELELRNKTSDGTVIIEKQPWKIHENTYGYDFKLNVDKIIDELEERGNFIRTFVSGDQGGQGETGDDGVDDLDTGPQGDDGDDGDNAPFPGTLLQDPNKFEFESDDIKSIVNIQVERDETGNFLLLTRGNVGEADACPNEIEIEDFETTLILVLDNDPARAEFKKINIGDRVICSFCSNLFFLDINTINEQIFERFKSIVNGLKEAKEALILSWLNTLVSVFNQQKNAICCALENCASKKRNQADRQYIEQTRVQAAQGGFKIEFGDQTERAIIDTDSEKACDQAEQVVVGTPCEECLVTVTLDPNLNAGAPNQGVQFSLVAGDYVVQIQNCCFKNNRGDWNGMFALRYVSSGQDKELRIPNLGSFPTSAEARNVYGNFMLTFGHDGGDIIVYYPDNMPDNNSGTGSLCITPLVCAEVSGGGIQVLQQSQGGIASKSQLVVEDLGVDSCNMEIDKIAWYEYAWKNGACCGAYLTVDGISYIVVKKSIGVDMACGGGESELSPCISTFLDVGKGHPAFAFPTIDGKRFMGMPKSGTQLFVEDSFLESAVLRSFKDNNYMDKKGNLKNIDFILFPGF